VAEKRRQADQSQNQHAPGKGDAIGPAEIPVPRPEMQDQPAAHSAGQGQQKVENRPRIKQRAQCRSHRQHQQHCHRKICGKG
jgi:hypothetical protein